MLAGLKAVPQESCTNMLDYSAVIRLVFETGYHAAADWITEHVSLYSAGLFHGFVISKPGQEER